MILPQIGSKRPAGPNATGTPPETVTGTLFPGFDTTAVKRQRLAAAAQLQAAQVAYQQAAVLAQQQNFLMGQNAAIQQAYLAGKIAPLQQTVKTENVPTVPTSVDSNNMVSLALGTLFLGFK